MAKTSAEFRDQLAEAEEYEEIKGDFPEVHDWEKEPELKGVYVKTESITAKGKARVIHTFQVDGVERQVWGTAILDSRLSQLDGGERVKVVRRGKVPTSSGNLAWDFGVYVARSAFKKAGA